MAPSQLLLPPVRLEMRFPHVETILEEGEATGDDKAAAGDADEAAPANARS